jgi:gamma-glutamyltranspeptidase/glutathione hydrolase
MLLQSLNILENFDLKGMGYNSPAYIHTLYQTMNLTFADRDFYYGDPYFSPKPPIKGLLSKAYAKERAKLIDPAKNNPGAQPGDPYPFEGRKNPVLYLLPERASFTDSTGNKKPDGFVPKHDAVAEHLQRSTTNDQMAYQQQADSAYADRLWRGTTSVEAADEEGWAVSITPSGGWMPACIAGRTGIGMSQRLQSFVLDSALSPFNVIAPGKRPRVTLTPSMALKDGKPFLSFAVQGGDTQDQNLLQFFLNMVEFGMTVQQATEAANINSNQLWLSLGGMSIKERQPRPGSILLNNNTPEKTRTTLQGMGYKLSFTERSSGPINAIFFDRVHGSLWGGSSNHGEDYGIGW